MTTTSSTSSTSSTTTSASSSTTSSTSSSSTSSSSTSPSRNKKPSTPPPQEPELHLDTPDLSLSALSLGAGPLPIPGINPKSIFYTQAYRYFIIFITFGVGWWYVLHSDMDDTQQHVFRELRVWYRNKLKSMGIPISPITPLSDAEQARIHVETQRTNMQTDRFEKQPEQYLKEVQIAIDLYKQDADSLTQAITSLNTSIASSQHPHHDWERMILVWKSVVSRIKNINDNKDKSKEGDIIKDNTEAIAAITPILNPLMSSTQSLYDHITKEEQTYSQYQSQVLQLSHDMRAVETMIHDMPYLVRRKIVREAQLFYPYLKIQHGCWPQLGDTLRDQRTSLLSRLTSLQDDIEWIQSHISIQSSDGELKQFHRLLTNVLRDLSYYQTTHAPTSQLLPQYLVGPPKGVNT